MGDKWRINWAGRDGLTASACGPDVLSALENLEKVLDAQDRDYEERSCACLFSCDEKRECPCAML